MYASFNVRNIFSVTILILIDGFLQYKLFLGVELTNFVTILILIDGFLQFNAPGMKKEVKYKSQSLF